MTLQATAALKPHSTRLDFPTLKLLPEKNSATRAPAPRAAVLGEKPVEVKAEEKLRPTINEVYGRLPLSFEANRGQSHEQVKFLSRGRGYTLFLTSTEAVMVLTKQQWRKHSAPGDLGQMARLESLPRFARAGTESRTKNGSAADSASSVLRMKLVGANSDPEISG
ncbi:MAG TPA: hypothetical protein VGL11_19500, partial [Candidatus Binatia bacterium]